jgi:drug/metabolite transporter (DMT)-like permease
MVLEGVLFGVGAAVGWGLADYTTAAITPRGGHFAMLLAAHTAGVAFMALLAVAVVDVPELTTGQWAACVALGPLSVLTYMLLFRALALGPLAVVSPVLSGWGVVTVVLALVVLGERLDTFQAVGCAAILIGVLFAATRLGTLEEGQARFGPGVAFGVAALVGLGFYNFFLGDLAKEIGWFMPIFVSRTAGVALMIAMAAHRGDWPWRRLERRQIVAATVVCGVGASCAVMSFSRGAEVSSLAITSAAASIYPFFPLAAGVVLLKERIATSQVAGVVLIVGGLAVLGFAG